MQQLGDTLGALVRPLIALVFAGVSCYAFIIGRLNADQWLGLATMVIAFYFAAKSAENANRRAGARSTDIQIDNVERVNVDRDQPSPTTREHNATRNPTV